MKELVTVLIALMVLGGCGGRRVSVLQKEKEASAYQETISGRKLEDPKRYRIDPGLLARYRSAISANANQLILRSDPGDDLFHVTEVQIESVFLGEPSIVGARVSGVVDSKFDRWRLMHPEGQKAEFVAHYLFNREGMYQGVRNSELVRVWD